jgi:hypothetical protein
MTVRLLAATAALVAAGAFAGTAAADPPTGTNANGCVGALVSNAAHFWASDDSVKGGFGAQAKALNVNPGDAIQAAATAICGKHQ